MSGGNKMRTTLNIDEGLINKASALTGIRDKTELVKLGLETLIQHKSAKRLAKLEGTEEKLEPLFLPQTGEN
jgi:hypothetical protein